MAIEWRAQACDLHRDPQSGAQITRLTASVMSNANLYFEQPHTTPDGRRVAYSRAHHADPRLPPTELCVADLQTLRVASIDTDVASTWFATSSWTGLLHYVRHNGELIRVDLNTLEKTIILTHWPLPQAGTLWSVTPDMRYLITGRRTDDFHSEIIRVDMHTGEWRIIIRSPDILNHIQIDHVRGRDMLVQVNRQLRMDHQGQRRAADDGRPRGATHMLIDIDGENRRDLVIGEPHTGESTGHATWLGDTGRIATPVHWPSRSVAFTDDADRPPHDPRHPHGNHIIVGPGDESATVFHAPEHLFVHASTSKCGRFFVADSVTHGVPGRIEIVVGCFDTGRYRTLVADCGASMGGPAASHAHPFFTADNANVIYNADPHGICHLHAARVPDDFLSSLLNV